MVRVGVTGVRGAGNVGSRVHGVRPARIRIGKAVRQQKTRIHRSRARMKIVRESLKGGKREWIRGSKVRRAVKGGGRGHRTRHSASAPPYLRYHSGVRSIEQGGRASARRLHARQAGQRGQRSRRQRPVAVMMVVVMRRGPGGGGGGKVQTGVGVQKWMRGLGLRRLHRGVERFGAIPVST